MNRTQQAAEFLVSARLGQRIIENIPPEDYPGSPTEAYRVQERVVTSLTRHNGSSVIGYKLACTNRPVMELLGVSGPFSGRLMSHSTHESGVSLDASDFIRRVVEAEFAFVMGETFPESRIPFTVNLVKPRIGAFIPAIEIVDYRYADFTQVGGNALIADNAIHGACVLGDSEETRWRTMELAQHPVRLMVNGDCIETGMGANVLDSPLNALVWLANHLQRFGSRLEAGDVVITGTACNVYPAQAEDAISVDFGELGYVSMSFDG